MPLELTVFSTIQSSEPTEKLPTVGLFKLSVSEVDRILKAHTLVLDDGFEEVRIRVPEAQYFLDSEEQMYLSFDDLTIDETGFNFKNLRDALTEAQRRIRTVNMVPAVARVRAESIVFESHPAFTDDLIVCQTVPFNPVRLVESACAVGWINPFTGIHIEYEVAQ